MILINRLKELRARRGWTQEELAKRVEVSRQTIISIEKGEYVPSTVLALKITKVFQANFEEVFNLENRKD